MISLERAVAGPRRLSAEDLETMLACEEASFQEELFAAARDVKARCGKTSVLPRGLVECSNVCAKDCLYCGIRKGNAALPRYRIPEEEVLACCDEARRRGYPAVAFQAGEIESEANTAYYERLLAKCRDLEVTLSLGEQEERVYRRWKEAGALRYLIRLETSRRDLYARIHPATCSFDRRLNCIRTLKRVGFVTGSGVMIGLPGQTLGDLARDIVFYGEEDLDMVGMGPYVPTPGTPLADAGAAVRPGDLALACRMIALTRLYLHDVNIVAATALEALDPAGGRSRGLDAGANVMMPNLTPPQYGNSYRLYPGKAPAPGGAAARACGDRP